MYIRVLGLEVVDQWWYSARLAKSDSVITPCTASGQERKINTVTIFITKSDLKTIEVKCLDPIQKVVVALFLPTWQSIQLNTGVDGHQSEMRNKKNSESRSFSHTRLSSAPLRGNTVTLF